MKFEIREAKIEDTPACHQLIIDLAVYENAPNAVTNTVEQFTKDGFGEDPIYRIYVAEAENGDILGLALFMIGYSTWKGKLLYLDDLVVKAGFRRFGIGTALINKVVNYAKQNAVKIVKWQVLDWNRPAINLYKKLGLTLDDEWIDCKIYERQFDDFGS